MNTLLNTMIENGKFCKVLFRKKDGTIGTVHGRTGVHKHSKGGKATHNRRTYITFWDINKGYRAVNRNRIIAVNGVHLRVHNNEVR